MPTVNNPMTGEKTITDQEKSDMYPRYCKNIVERIDMTEHNFNIAYTEVIKTISMNNISHSQDDFSLGNIKFMVKNLQKTLQNDHIIRTQVLDKMPKPITLANIIHQTYHNIRNTNTPFHEFIFNINFNNSFKIKIDK